MPTKVAFLGLVLSGVAVLTTLGVPLLESTRVAMTIVLQATCGFAILSRLLPQIPQTLASLLGPGFIVGCLLWVVPTQLLGSGRVVSTLVFSAMTIVVIRTYLEEVSHLAPLSIKEGLLVCGVAFLVMSGEWPFMAVPGICLLAGFMCIGSESRCTWYRVSLLILTIVLGVGGLIWGIRRWGGYWWLVTDDYSYYQALQVHLAQFGATEQFGPTNILIYHWITPAWVGQLSSLLSLSDWIAISKVSPFIFSVAIGSSTLALLQFLLGARERAVTRASIVLLIWVILISRIDFAGISTYAVFGILPTALLVILASAQNSLPRILVALLWFAVVLVTIFSKLFAAFALAVFASTQFLKVMWPRLSDHMRQISGLLVTIIALAAVLNSGQLFAEGWSISVVPLDELIRTRIAPELHRVIPLVLALLLTTAGHREYTPWQLRTSLLSLLVSIGVIASLLQAGSAIDILNFYLGPLYFVALILSVLEVNLATKARPTSTPILRPIVGFLLGILVLLLSIPYLREVKSVVELILGREFSMSHLLMWSSTVIIVAAVLLAVSMHLRAPTEWRISAASVARYGFTTGAFLVVTLMLVGTLTDSFTRDTSVWQSRTSSLALAQLGSPQAAEVGRWISRNTAGSAKIGTNDLCEPQLNTPATTKPDRGTKECVFGVDYTLAHTSRRRFLVLGPRFAYQNESARDLAVDVSLRFAQELTPDSAELLINEGVDYFVLYQPTSTQLKMLSGSLVFRNTDYAVVELRALS